MILSSVDLPEPFSPSTPILAPGKKLRDTPLRICRFGGTILPSRFIVKTYCAIWVTCERDAKEVRSRGRRWLRKCTRPGGYANDVSRIAGPEAGHVSAFSAESGILLARTDHAVICRIAAPHEHRDRLRLVQLGHRRRELLGRGHRRVAYGQDNVALLQAGACRHAVGAIDANAALDVQARAVGFAE